MRQCLFILLAAVFLAPAATADDKLYKWVDDEGNITYQDQPPPGAAGDAEALDDNEEGRPAAGRPDVEIVLYSSGDCAECDSVRQLLLSRGVPFKEKLIGGDPALAAELREIAGVRSIPALVVGDEVILGHNEELILASLDEAGFPAGALPEGPGAQTEVVAPSEDDQPLTREQLEQMTPVEIEQAARDAALRGEDNDLFEEDEGFLTLNDSIFADPGPSGARGEEINDLEGSTADRKRVVEP